MTEKRSAPALVRDFVEYDLTGYMKKGAFIAAQNAVKELDTRLQKVEAAHRSATYPPENWQETVRLSVEAQLKEQVTEIAKCACCENLDAEITTVRDSAANAHNALVNLRARVETLETFKACDATIDHLRTRITQLENVLEEKHDTIQPTPVKEITIPRNEITLPLDVFLAILRGIS